ncbi:MAG: (d)CMP kinase [Sphingobacteriales bacterium]|jgi:cytidylate kinase|nr:(d)CMP kinase [Sphingobacteriales bacterium]
MLAPIIIAIDGYSSCGKSTLAIQLAERLSYKYVDTGAMYRALTLYLLKNQIDIHHPDMVAEALSNIQISFGLNEITQKQYTILNGENVEDEIRINPRVASAVSVVSAQSEVRKFLVNQQQAFGATKGIVMDGRDIGTVVFPNAELKLFITAEPMIRAQRRLDELQEKGQHTTLEEVLANLQKRDLMDTTRADSPLLKAADAIEIDNSYLSRQDQLNKVLQLVKNLNQNAQ